MRPAALLVLATSLTSVASAALQGFNYGATKPDGSFRYQADFEEGFSTAKNLVGTSGFSSARLFTMIQGGSSTNEPIQAIPAAIAQKTSLLLGLWASGGDGPFDAEITALKTAIDQYGSAFTDLVVGISVGSEDLYRLSPVGIQTKSGYGCEPDKLASYISKLRQTIANTPLAKAPVGHVDTWTAWVNGSNQAVIDSCDFIGMDAYPYFQNTMENSIENGKNLFEEALAATQGAVGGREVWITETGWPVVGETENLAVPSTENAKTYWDEVGCPRFGNVNIWWYTLQHSSPAPANPGFGIVGNTLSTTPLFDLSCSNTDTSNDTSASPSASTSVPASAVSSIRSAATGGGVASSGSPLVPSQAGGAGGPAGTGVAGGAGGPAGTGAVGAGTGVGPAPTGGSSGNYTAPVGNGSGPKTNPGGSNPTATGGANPGATGGSTPGGAGGSNPGGAGGSNPSAPGGNSPSSPSGTPVVNSSGASMMSASFIGAIGVFFAAVVAL